MRLTLEQLKALGDNDLKNAWEIGMFPFEWLGGGCQNCMTQHTLGSCSMPQHKAFRDEVVKILGWLYYPEIEGIQKLCDHLEELYALRIFYDHLYPQPQQLSEAKQTEQEKVNV